jgi:tRNA-binding protein
MIEYDDFVRVEMRVGRVLVVEDFPKAHKPTYKIEVDFGPEVGRLWTSAQAKSDYVADDLVGRLVIGAVNLTPKRIAGFESQFLLLGAPGVDGGLALLRPDRDAVVGSRVY